MELLKALFESAELPTEFKEKTTTLFEAAVDEKVKAQLVSIQESYDTRLEAAKAEHLVEAVKTIDSIVEEVVLEWAKENAVALDSEIKGQIAESFLQSLKGVFEKADIELTGGTAGKELVKLQEANAELAKQAEASKAALTEAQEKLTAIAKKEIIAEVTAGLADTQVHRVTKLVEAFDFKSAEDFRAKAALVVEAVGGKIAGVNSVAGDGINLAVPAGGSKVSNKVETPGVENEDGELVKKPGSASVDSAEGKTTAKTGEQVIAQPNLATGQAPNVERTPPGLTKEQQEAAPHLHANLVEETLKLFRK